MKISSQKVKEIYSGKLASKYDFSMPHSFQVWKRRAVEASSLKQGDKVLVFCCGTGSDFPFILKRIGKEGKIVAVDFSSQMLSLAQEKIRKNNWHNIELIESDVTQFEERPEPKADAGICTLGLSIIPAYRLAYSSLLRNVKPGGEIIIGDMQLAAGWLSRFDPITLFMSKRYGGTYEGHRNSLKIYELMKNELKQVRKKEYFLGAYYYAIGQVPLSGQAKS